MSYLYGPYTPTAGTLTSQSVDQTAVAIRVTNDSPNDLWVDFGPSRPAVPSPLVSAAAFDAVVQAWSSQVLMIPGPYPNNTWAGIVWLLPVAGGGLAASGTISSRGNVYLTTYAEGEDAGTNHAVSRQADATSQSRVIIIPTQPSRGQRFEASYSGITFNTHNVVTGGALASNPGNWNGTSQFVTVYVYATHCALYGMRWLRFSWEIEEVDGGGAILASHNLLLNTQLLIDKGHTPLHPGAILTVRFAPLASAVNLVLGFILRSGYPLAAGLATFTLDGAIVGDVDLTGQTPPPAIGNGAGTPPGAIY